MNILNYSTHETAFSRRDVEGNSIGAVIDIGSNSIKLLVGQVAGSSVDRIYSASEAIKVGQGVFQARRLRPEVIQRAACAVADLARQAHNFSPSIFRIIATSAVREAVNRADLVQAIESRAQKRVEILSGEEEARLVFEGVRREPGLVGSPLMVVDVGGGSTQVIVSERGPDALYYSFSFGSLRLLEALGLSDRLSRDGLARCRASAANFVQHQVIPSIGRTRFEGGPFSVMRLVGTGGKLRKLATAGNSSKNANRGDGMSLTSKRLTAMIDGLWRMMRRERAAMLAIPEQDADVTLTAAVTLEAVLQRFGFEILHTSRSSLRDGAILKAFREKRSVALQRVGA